MTMNRFTNSWEVAKQSWAVLKNNPSLMIFPIVSSIGTLLVSIPFIVPMVMLALGKEHKVATMGPLQYLLGFVFYAATYTVVVFFNSALVTCAYKNLKGEATTPTEGIQNAIRHLPKILMWALMAATVGQVLRAIQERAGIIGTLVGGLLGLGWNLAIFFVIPGIVLENLGPIDALKASVAKLKATWGEQLILGGGMGLVSFLATALPIALLVTAAVFAFIANLVALGLIILVACIMYVMAAAVVLSCLSTIYRTALYVYSSTGALPSGFTQTSIEGAFRQKQPMFRGRSGR